MRDPIHDFPPSPLKISPEPVLIYLRFDRRELKNLNILISVLVGISFANTFHSDIELRLHFGLLLFIKL